MAATSSSVPFFGISEEDQYNSQQQQPQHSSSTPSSSAAAAQPGAPQKKKRNLPGNPNPDAEVIALSPKALLATNRFICEVCNKGFQREQNLQLHRRGHNLPWKLKQKNPNEIRRRVYVCPEPTCVHHDPSRALGDLTGIKKHYCRKHGEKKWKCDKCSKRYAVQSDWKAHSKTCGTREYRCDCGTLFSRRDSFITHRAFCDALAQESARIPTGMNTLGSHLYDNNGINLGLPHQVNSQLASLHDQTHASADLLRLGGNDGATQLDHLAMPSFRQPQPPQSTPFYLGGSSSQDFNEDTQLLQSKPFHGLMQLQDHLQVNTNSASSSSATAASNLFNLRIFANSSNRNTIANNNDAAMNQNSHILISDQFNNASESNEPATLFAGSLMRNHIDANMSSMYNHFVNNESVSPHMSATALLQKAAQMGATSSCSSPSSLLRGLGSSYASSAKNTSFRAGFDGVREGSAAQVGSETHFQGLVNSLAHGNIGIFSGGNEQETGFNSFGGGMCNMNEDKLQRNLSAGGIGASDRLTRDFLGVGSVMRNMGGGMQQREQHLGIDMDSLRSELKSGSSARPFVGGSLQ